VGQVFKPARRFLNRRSARVINPLAGCNPAPHEELIPLPVELRRTRLPAAEAILVSMTISPPWPCGKAWPIVAIVGLLICSPGCDKQRNPDKVIVPIGFSGWITVNYKIPGAPLLPRENGMNVIKIDHEGRISTSSDYEVGFAKDEYYFDDGSSLISIPEDGHGPGPHAWRLYRAYEKDRTFDRFFVGTEQEYAAASR